MADGPLRLAENIVLLQKLCNKPISPVNHELNDLESNGGRAFQLRDELKIAECLTYLSTYSNNPERVMALCLEEVASHQGLIVSVATNTGSLTYLQKGLQSIVQVLEQQAKSPKEDHLDDLLLCVIAHGRARVVRRLGFKNVIDSNKQLDTSTAGRLEKVLRHFAKPRPRGVQPYASLYDMSSELSRLSKQFYKSATPGSSSNASNSVLMAIVFTAANIWRHHRKDIHDMLTELPNTAMEPGTKESLKSRLEHLGHYIPTAKRLLRYAQRFTVFRSIEVRPVYMAPLNLTPFLTNTENKSDTGLLNRYIHRSEELRAPQVSAAMNTLLGKKKQNLTVWQREVRNQVEHNQRQGSYKVHAEVQLLLDYEQREDVAHPPRILKSSKDACFLCDLFIRTYGKFHIPKTHGRVYGLWMLPAIDYCMLPENKGQTLVSAVGKFNNAVEELLLQVVVRETRPLRDPRESGIFSLASSSTQLSAVSRTLSATRQDTSVVARSSSSLSLRPDSGDEYGSGDGRATTGKSQKSCGLSCTSSGASTNEAQSVWSRPKQRDNHNSHRNMHSTEASASPTMPSSTTIPLPRTRNSNGLLEESKGQTILLQAGDACFHTLTPTTTAIRFHTPKIHIELSRSEVDQMASQSCLDLPCQRNQDIRIEATWLVESQFSEVLGQYEESVADLEQEWRTLELKEGIMFTPAGLLIKKGVEIVGLRASYVGKL